MLIRRWFKPFGGAIAFALMSLIVLGVLGWVTYESLHIERAEREASARAKIQNLERIALWQIDGTLLPTLGVESNRPYTQYFALSYPSSPTRDNPGEFVATSAVPSPLLSATMPDWMLLHFQLDPIQGWDSPQVLAPEVTAKVLRITANPASLSNVSPERQKLLESLKERFPVKESHDRLMKMQEIIPLDAQPAPPTMPSPAISVGVLEGEHPPAMSQGAQGFAQNLGRVEMVPAPPSQAPMPMPANGDFAQRLNSLNNATQMSNQLNPENLRPFFLDMGTTPNIATDKYDKANASEKLEVAIEPNLRKGVAKEAPSKDESAGSYRNNPNGIGGGVGSISGGLGGLGEHGGKARIAGNGLGGLGGIGGGVGGISVAEGAEKLTADKTQDRVAAGAKPPQAPIAITLGAPKSAGNPEISQPPAPIVAAASPLGKDPAERFGASPANPRAAPAEVAPKPSPREAEVARGNPGSQSRNIHDPQNKESLPGKVQETAKKEMKSMEKAIPRTASPPKPPVIGLELNQVRPELHVPDRILKRLTDAKGVNPDGVAPPIVVPEFAFKPTMHLGPIRAHWLTAVDGTQNLALVRAAHLENRVVFQGVILDWPRLREHLIGIVQDTLPNVSLSPALDSDDSTDRRLASLPAMLDPTPLAAVPFGEWTSLRLGLALTWGAALIALAGVGIGGWSLMSLSERRFRFVSAVTHELRTPLTSLRLYLDLLTSGLITDPLQQKEYLQTLSTESDRLNRLIENVLDFARLEKRSLALHRQSIRVDQLLEQVRSTWDDRLAADGKSLVLHSTLPGDMTISTDARILDQILGNLIDNSRKYARSASDNRIWLTARPLDARRIAFEVEDRGPGVAAGDRATIFQPFQRGTEAELQSGGAGLGLALTRQWTKLLGGTISYRTAEGGVGACFRVELPTS